MIMVFIDLFLNMEDSDWKKIFNETINKIVFDSNNLHLKKKIYSIVNEKR